MSETSYCDPSLASVGIRRDKPWVGRLRYRRGHEDFNRWCVLFKNGVHVAGYRTFTAAITTALRFPEGPLPNGPAPR